MAENTKPAASNDKQADDKATRAAVDAAAGAPAQSREAAEALPEKDAVQKAYKKQLTADDAATELEAKTTIVKESPDADETPSGAALLATAGQDPVKRGDEYARIKRAVRLGSVEDAE